jgi:hypothetical protein
MATVERGAKMPTWNIYFLIGGAISGVNREVNQAKFQKSLC